MLHITRCAKAVYDIYQSTFYFFRVIQCYDFNFYFVYIFNFHLKSISVVYWFLLVILKIFPFSFLKCILVCFNNYITKGWQSCRAILCVGYLKNST